MSAGQAAGGVSAETCGGPESPPCGGPLIGGPGSSARPFRSLEDPTPATHWPHSRQRSIGAPGFEPGTSATRTQRSTGLSHAPDYLSGNFYCGVGCTSLRNVISLDTLLGASRNPLTLPRPEPTLGAAPQLAWVRTLLTWTTAEDRVGRVVSLHGQGGIELRSAPPILTPLRSLRELRVEPTCSPLRGLRGFERDDFDRRIAQTPPRLQIHGRGGIRTHAGVSPHDFQSCALSHSATRPNNGRGPAWHTTLDASATEGVGWTALRAVVSLEDLSGRFARYPAPSLGSTPRLRSASRLARGFERLGSRSTSTKNPLKSFNGGSGMDGTSYRRLARRPTRGASRAALLPRSARSHAHDPLRVSRVGSNILALDPRGPRAHSSPSTEGVGFEPTRSGDQRLSRAPP